MIATVIRVVLVSLAAIIAGLAVLLHTSFLREEALDLVETTLKRSIRGDVELGRLEGILLHRATFRGVSVRDRSGRTVLEVDMVRVEPDIVSLIADGVLRFESVQVIGPRLYLPSRILVTDTSTAAKKSTELTPIPIDLASVRVIDGFVSYAPQGGLERTFEGIELSGRATVLPNELSIEGLRVADRSGTSVRVPHVVYELDSGRLQGRFVVRALGRSIGSAAGLKDLRGSIRLAGGVTHPRGEAPWYLQASGRLNRAPLVLTATASSDFQRLSGRLELKGPLDPSELHAQAPEGHLQGIIAATIADAAPERLTGSMRARLSGRLRYSAELPPIDLRRLQLDATADGGRFSATGRLDSDAAQARFFGAGRLRRGEVELAQARVSLAVRELRAVTPPSANLSGALTVNARARGTTRDFELTARVRGTNVVAGELHLGRGRGDLELAGSLKQPRGRVDLDLKRMSSGTYDLGDARVRLARRGDRPWRIQVDARGAEHLPHLALSARLALNARGELDPKRVRLEIDELTAELLDHRWRATSTPSLLAFQEERGWILVARDLTLTSTAGTVSASARVDLGGQRLRSAQLEVAQLDLELLRSFAGGEREGPEGKVSLSARITGRRAHVEATLFGEELGRAELDADATLPVRSLDPKAYRRLSIDALDRASVLLKDVNLGPVQEALGLDPAFLGEVDGSLGLFDGGRGLEVSLELVEGRAKVLSPELRLSGRFEKPRRGDLTAELAGFFGARQVMHAKAEVALPLKRLSREGPEALGKLDASIDARLDRLPLSVLDPNGTATGTISGSATLAKRGPRLDVDLHAWTDQLHWDRRWPKLDLDLDARMRGGTIGVAGSIDAGPSGRVELSVKADAPAEPWSPAAWREAGVRTIESANVELVRGDLAAWSELLDLEPMTGEVTVDLEVARGARRLDGTIELKNVVLPEMDRPIRPIHALATVISKSGRTSAHGDLFEHGRPVVAVEVTVPRDVVQLSRTTTTALMRLPLEGEVHAHELSILTLSRMLAAGDDASGRISIDGYLSGTIADPLLKVDLSSEDAKIRTSAFSMIEGYAELTRERLASEMRMVQRDGGELEVDAKIGLGRDTAIRGHIDATTFDLGFLSLFASRTKGTLGGVAGKLDAALLLSGTRTDPDLEGKIQVEDLRAVMMYPIPPVDDTSIDLRFAEDKVIFGIEGRSGDGRFEITGNGRLPALTRPNLSGKMEVADLSVAAGPRLVETDLEANWHVTSEENLIEAAVVIVDGNASLEADSEDLLPIRSFDDVVLVDELGEEHGVTPPEAAEQKVDVVDTATKLRMTVRTDGSIPIKSEELNASVTVDLVIETTDEGPIAKGEINVSDGTIALFGGTRWFIEQGDIIFPGGAEEEPRINIRIYHDFTDVVVYVGVVGTPSSPELQLTSDPATYTYAQLLGFVLGGSPDASRADASLGEEAAGIAAGFIAGQIQSRIADKLPIDTLSVDIEDGARASSVLVGKWITQRLFVAYNYRMNAPEDENASEGIFRVLFGHGWMLEATYGDRGNGAADVLWITRF